MLIWEHSAIACFDHTFIIILQPIDFLKNVLISLLKNYSWYAGVVHWQSIYTTVFLFVSFCWSSFCFILVCLFVYLCVYMNYIFIYVIIFLWLFSFSIASGPQLLQCKLSGRHYTYVSASAKCFQWGSLHRINLKYTFTIFLFFWYLQRWLISIIAAII